MVRETRHLWVGNLPENVREEKIIEHFKRYGRVESVKILPKRGSEGGVAAFVDFVDIKSAQKAHNSVNKMGDRDLRTDYNEPGTIPSAARGLDDTVSIGSRSREVSGFRGGGGGPAYGPPPSLHGREGRYERRLDGASDNRERTYEHSAYGHHERGTGGFDRTRHYEQDYYRDPRERTLQHGLYYSSRSRSPSRFDAHDPRYEPRAREQFTLSSVVHRDIYRDDIPREVRGRRQERNYQHSRSRSPHSSQSRNQSPQRLANQTTRPPRSPSGSGSRSRSSSSDSVSSSSSTSSDSDSSSSSSDESPARSVQSTAVPAPPAQPPPPLEKDEPRKSFGIKVQNLPVRSTDTSLKDGLFHEFKKYGKVTSVQIHGASEERYGLVFFRQQEDQEKALNASKGKLFFGMQIEVTAWIGPETESENEFRPLDERIDEFHPKATRTLFIGNLEKTTTYHDLRNIFQRFGEIVDIDIKKVNGVPQYAFLQYCDIASVCKAIKKMDGEYLGNNRLKLGFGKSMPTNCVWLDGLSTNVTEQYLTRHFCRYGPVVKVVFDRLKGMALILYNEIEYAQAAVKETKGRKIGGNKIKVDFANRESQLAFYRSMESSGQDIRDFYEMLAERRDERRAPYHEYPADRTYYETVRAPGTYPEDPRREYQARGREFYPEWDPYQGDYYDPRYYDDPREYRDYRDPYEQDIREYSYRQRERERERERFESDRDRDHERRTIERSQSPTHSRRAQSPVASPSQSERLQSDSERRIYSRSSDRSGSCSSLSPPRYEKLDKARADRYNKNDKVDKERTIDPERTDKEKRVVRKEKPEKLEKEKLDKLNFRKLKAPSPSSPSSETDKEVKEKEGKVVDQPAVDKQRGKSENDTVKSPPPEQKLQFSRVDHVEVVDKEVKLKPKKHLKPEQSTEGVNTMDIDKLEARKRRFADANLKPDRQKLEVKRTSLEEEEVRLGLKKQVELPSSREVTIIKEGESERKPPRKELLNKREHKRVKPERLVTVTSPRDGQEPANISIPQLSEEQGVEREIITEESRRNYTNVPDEFSDHRIGQERSQSADAQERLGIDIDYTQSYRKQMERSRRLKQQQELETAKLEKFGSPRKDVEEYERRSLVHEVGKPPQDVTDDSPPSKRKKTDPFEFDASTKRERNYRSSRQMSEDSERNMSSPGLRHFCYHEDDDNTLDSPSMTVREDLFKFNPYEASRREQMTDITKIKLSNLSSENEINRWDTHMKHEANRFDVSFPSSVVKRESIRKRSVRELEPGEVPSDSDDENDNKTHSPKVSTLLEGSRLSFYLRDREERLPSSLERNKFYSFALDKTITPDTKALLERAKSLSSSREENWSFLDRDSRFASFRNNKDKEKVESAPRPIPSWYMKKKKIRTDSEGKMGDKKEDHKEEEQERQELFASRFLHSSIFEQDSKRLQHLERKDDDLDFTSGRLYGRQVSSDGTNSSSELVQEPVVLFHSRFMELTRMQQKEKEKDQKPKEPENKGEKVSESGPAVEESKPKPEPSALASATPNSRTVEPAVTNEGTKEITPEPMISDDSLSTEHPSYLDTKPPTPGASFSHEDISLDQEPETLKFNVVSSGQVQKSEESSEDKETSSSAITNTVISHKAEEAPEAQSQISDKMEAEPAAVSKDRKPSKNKRTKASAQTSNVVEKPATRKSERIDREKLKRSTSPRGEALKSAEIKTSAKSPSYAAEPETSEPNLPVARTRRRNVRSVYATTGDNEGPSPVKDSTELPRSTRKRGEKETQETSNPPKISRRGRPPKLRRKTGEDTSPIKSEPLKQEAEETGIKETIENSKPVEGWKSPRSQKLAQTHSPTESQHAKKGGKAEPKTDISAESSEDTAVPPEHELLGAEKSPKVKSDKEEVSEQNLDGKELDTETCPSESTAVEVVEKKTSKSISGRYRTSKAITEIKPLCLKNVEIQLRPVEEDTKPVEQSPPKKTLEKETAQESEPSSEAALLAKQMELEQAVENIAKLTEVSALTSFKEPSPDEPEIRPEDEVEKPAHQASETELAAAIDSIMKADEISADTDSFPAPPPYAADAVESEITGDSLVMSTHQEAIEPETETNQAVTNILETESEVGCNDSSLNTSSVPAIENEGKDSKELKQPGVANAVETSPKEVLKEPVKAAPEKSLKTPSETIANKSSNDTEPLAESREPVDLPPHSAPAEDKKSPTLIKVRHSVENIPVTLSSVQKLSIPALPTTTTAKIPLSIPSGVVTSHSSSSGIVPDWMARHDDTCAQSTPPPAPPPDTKASDLDTNSSTLRKILMEPKYVSSSSSNTLVTTSHGEPVSASRLEETVHPIVETIKPVLEEKPAVSAINTHVPSVVEAPVFNEKEKLSNSVVAPKATSVISKMPSSFDLEETPRIILGNRGSSSLPSQPLPVPGMTLPKQKYRPSINNDNRFHMVSMGVIGEDTRPVESGQLNTGSSPGLRVNTSEGVVVLSYSGQKTEGPQRISAKISQIPPASAVDIEFQQSVSKSQIKQEPVTPSQSTPKGPQTPTGYTYNTQPVISSIKQEHSPLEKSEPIHHTVPTPSSQSGPVKILSPGGSTLMFSQLIHQQNVMAATKKEPVALKAEPTKVPQPANLSPGLSPHHPSPDVNHVSSGPSTPTERALPHPGIKQEPHSPRTCGHSPSPFPKVCQSSSTSSPVQSINASVMLGPGIPVPQYVSPMHPEQSVIMPPHSVTQTVSLGHLSQGEVRMNTPPLPGIPYGMRSEALHSPRPALQPQRSNTPQPTTIRDMVMPPLPSQHPSEEEVHHYHPGIRRGSGSLQPEVLVMQPDYRMHSTGLRLEQYNMPQEMLLPRDVRMMMHPHIGGVGDHHPDSRQVRTPDGSGKTPPTSKTPQPGKETTKPCEVKMSHSPHSETRLLGVPPGSQISALPLSQPVMVSHGVQLMHPAGGSFHDYRGVYSDMRNYHGPTQLAHPQYPGASPIGINLPSRSMTPSQVSHRLLLAQPTGIINPLLLPHQSKYPIVWQGLLALKNDTAAVQLHFVSGNNVLAHRSLPAPEGGPPLRIAQRMRLEASQLEGVARRMTVESDYCLLLALPCGRDQGDVVSQTESLKAAFISYLQNKQAAGIINVPNPGSNQPAYVLQIFPPCEFSESHLSRLAPDLLASISNISPHLMIVIASV
uniref:Msx2-interacting protein n=1 Tax=Latimeria chalumnae TaxID=7897 RepID=H3A1Y7_LATCH